jgi:hypothetical protein
VQPSRGARRSTALWRHPGARLDSGQRPLTSARVDGGDGLHQHATQNRATEEAPAPVPQDIPAEPANPGAAAPAPGMSSTDKIAATKRPGRAQGPGVAHRAGVRGGKGEDPRGLSRPRATDGVRPGPARPGPDWLGSARPGPLVLGRAAATRLVWRVAGRGSYRCQVTPAAVTVAV